MKQDIFGNLFNIKSGEIIPNQKIEISHGVIQKIETTDRKCSDILFPGLIDCHVHLVLEPDPKKPAFSPTETSITRIERVKRNCLQALKAGITTVRDCGYPTKDIFSIRHEINLQPELGARIITSGPCITQPNGHARNLGIEASGVDQLKRAVTQIVSDGADFIKVINVDQPEGFSTLELKAIVETAHRLGKKVACHVYQPKAFARAIDAGVDTLEHCTVLSNTLVKNIVKKSIIVIPTVECARDAVRYPEANTVGDEDITTEGNMNWQMWVNEVESGIKTLIKNKVKIACGTDCGFMMTDFTTVIREILAYIDLGMSPLQALQSATIVAAEAVSMPDKLGSIEVGKFADIVVYQDNPLINPHTLYQPRQIYRQGLNIFN